MHKLNIPQNIIDRVMERRGRLHVFENLESSRTAIIVIDMQNNFVMKGAPSEVPVAREIVPNINRLAAAARHSGGRVVWVITTFTKEGPGYWSLFFDHFVNPELSDDILQNLSEGQPGHEIWQGLDVKPEDPVVTKNRYSAFLPGSSNIVEILRSYDIDTVVITGTMTNICCESSARDAMMLNFKTIMVSNANAARSDEEHVATLSTFIQLFGDVMTTDEVIHLLEEGQQ
jgi:ureidoacrylate peracid hydrolase